MTYLISKVILFPVYTIIVMPGVKDAFLLGKLREEKDDIWTFIKMLIWLRMEIEKTSPDARNFVWPPKS